MSERHRRTQEAMALDRKRGETPARLMCFYRCEDGAGGRCYAWAEGVREAIEMARRCLPNVTAATLLFTSDDPPFVLEEEI